VVPDTRNPRLLREREAKEREYTKNKKVFRKELRKAPRLLPQDSTKGEKKKLERGDQLFASEATKKKSRRDGCQRVQRRVFKN